ncbi:MAG: alpha/beta hydrolase, partial [Pseudomonadota bacterium]|nr:alpha/beta hydrolase [Pseudomonadota bacterium]
MTPSNPPGHGDRTLTLADGRQLAYTDCGDPEGDPMFFAHGMPGSRLEGYFFDRAARAGGFRMITVDRPGIGRSEFQPGRTLLDYPRDIGQLADALGMDRFSHMGWSSGGSRTLACCHGLGERVELGICLSGYTHFPEYAADGALLQATRWPGPAMARLSPRLVRMAVCLVAWLSRFQPGLYLRSARQMASRQDRELLESMGSDGRFRADQLECLTSHCRAIATDLLTELGDWGFRLGNVRTPVLVYQGADDPFV